MAEKPTILWLRQDLRFHDNPAMRAAADNGGPVLCLYVLDEETPGEWTLGGAQRWWLHHSLSAFAADLERRGGKLIFRRGNPVDIVPQLADDIGAEAVHWTRRYAKWQVEVDIQVKDALKAHGVHTESHNGSLLYEPWEIATKTGGTYRVYSPYWKQIQARDDVRPALPCVDKLRAPAILPPSDKLSDWSLLPTKPNWASGFGDDWTPGEKGARDRWRSWLKTDDAKAYGELRNRPDKEGTSRLSPHLHFGEISIVNLWHEMREAMAAGTFPQKDGKVYLSELVWREFSHQLTFHQPNMEERPLMEKFIHFQWDNNPELLKAWQRGQTGYPIVDAGMRQLWQTGWMHNRVRMIVGSFLVKDLLIHWREGLDWFWDTLLDADPANNTASWQWIAGCGADAAPYFRVFNPTSQSEKFDPDGEYIRQFVPELARLPAKSIHEPHTAPALALAEAGVKLGETYPYPIVDHAIARKEALARYEDVRASSPKARIGFGLSGARPVKNLEHRAEKCTRFSAKRCE
ncbi:MAG: deoxyribodipyrimidine photo-lyase [Pseudomonadota bacterium]